MSENKNYEASVGTRCTAALREELVRRAAQDGRTLANYVRIILEKHVENGQKPPEQRVQQV